ncbi:MAG: DUF3667 domain-containing protein, partial [Ignavibacteriales bacterium]|nr:DUF3667 domain-containing protein [Ignavibacteriales bacterium]
DRDIDIPVKELASEFMEVIPSFDKRLMRTIRFLLLKPGLLTLEYLSGKRKQYISPFKLYFAISFLFFFLIALDDSDTKYVAGRNSNQGDTKDITDSKDTIYAFVDGKQSNLRFTLVDSAKSEKVFGHEVAVGLKRLKENPQLFFDKLKEYRPKIIFLLLPVFALLLKLLYVRSKILYIRHLVFAFYIHSFVFFILLCMNLLDLTGIKFLSSASTLLLLFLPANLYFGLQRVYGQTWMKTFIKFSLLTAAYGASFLFAFILAILFFVFVLYF